MRQKKFWFMLWGILVMFALALILPRQAVAASKYKVLHRFTGGADGANPQGGLVFDPAGSLYGTTTFGGVSPTNCGSSGCGTVFKLTPKAIIESLNLRRPIYRQTAAFGHFGRNEKSFTWEATDKAAALRAAAGLG